MVELVDTLVSGTSGRKAVQVRVLFWAQSQTSSVWLFSCSSLRSLFIFFSPRSQHSLHSPLTRFLPVPDQSALESPIFPALFPAGFGRCAFSDILRPSHRSATGPSLLSRGRLVISEGHTAPPPHPCLLAPPSSSPASHVPDQSVPKSREIGTLLPALFRHVTHSFPPRTFLGPIPSIPHPRPLPKCTKIPQKRYTSSSTHL